MRSILSVPFVPRSICRVLLTPASSFPDMELERLRKTDLTLTSTGEESGNRSILAVAGAKIELDKDLGVAVTFVSIDVTQKEGVETVRDWIQAKQKTL